MRILALVVFLQVCCRVLSAQAPSSNGEAEGEGSPWWQLVGVLLPPFLHGLCLCADRPRVAEGMLPPLVSMLGRELSAASLLLLNLQ